MTRGNGFKLKEGRFN